MIKDRQFLKRIFSVISLIVLISITSVAADTTQIETVISPEFQVPNYVHWLLEIARDEVGYTEEEHGRSKYGEWAGDPYAQWCAEYLCWCVDQVDKKHETELLKKVYPLYSGTNTGRDWFIRQGRYICKWGNIDGWGYQWLKGNDHFLKSGEYIPQPGDWIFFTWTSNTDTDHVAMVEYCSVDQNGEIWIHVLEGNKPSSVCQFSYNLNNSRILGFGTVHDVMDITMRFGNEGEKVLQLQTKLHKLGYLNEEYISGHFGNATHDALVMFQSRYGIKTNGIATIQTQNRIDQEIEYMIDQDPKTWMVIDEEE